MLQVEFSQAFRNYFPEFSAVLHSMGGAYVDYPANETRRAYLHPGKISVQLNVTMPSNGEKVLFEAARLPDALPGYTYVASVDLTRQGDVPVIVVSFDSKVQTDDVTIALTPQFLNERAPLIHCTGFNPDVPLEWIEGNSASTRYSMSVDNTDLSSLVLTTRSPLLCSQGWMPGVDILRLTDAQRSILQSLGLVISQSGSTLSLDFSDVLRHLRYEAGAKSTLFTLEAIGSGKRLNPPVSLEVVSLPVDLKVVSASDIVAGVEQRGINCGESHRPASRQSSQFARFTRTTNGSRCLWMILRHAHPACMLCASRRRRALSRYVQE